MKLLLSKKNNKMESVAAGDAVFTPRGLGRVLGTPGQRRVSGRLGLAELVLREREFGRLEHVPHARRRPEEQLREEAPHRDEQEEEHERRLDEIGFRADRRARGVAEEDLQLRADERRLERDRDHQAERTPAEAPAVRVLDLAALIVVRRAETEAIGVGEHRGEPWRPRRRQSCGVARIDVLDVRILPVAAGGAVRTPAAG